MENNLYTNSNIDIDNVDEFTLFDHNNIINTSFL